MNLPGYTGSRELGIRVSSGSNPHRPHAAEEVETPQDAGQLDRGPDTTVEDELDDSAHDELAHMGQFIEDTAVAFDVEDDLSDSDIPRSRHGIPLYMLTSFKV